MAERETDDEGGSGSNRSEAEALLMQARVEQCQRQSAGTELDLSNLNLSDVPVEVAALFPVLRRMDLRKNKIESLPYDFARAFPQLVVLNLADNCLTGLPEQFGGLRHLQKLSLANNQLHELPVSFSNLHTVEELSLAGNRLTMLDEEIGAQLVKLKTLDLSRNPTLHEIPLSFAAGLTMLRVVDLSGNGELAVVPDKLRRLHERNVILHSRAKRRELIARALRVRHAVGQTMLINAAIVNPTAASKKAIVSSVK